MAKGNMLLGYSRGSVGDVTFYRDGGEQRARARNRKPNNPRSNRQMYQRAKFAGAVKFFKQSYANFYRMAFENKKPNESDYNAFMRMNLAQSPLMSKTAFDKPGYPAIGHWTIAQGSMPTLQFAKNYGTQQDALAVILPVTTEETISNNTTIGEFSTILINSGLYMQGDIFTMVRVIVDADVEQLLTLPTATPEGNWNTYWFLTQIVLDTADTRKIGLSLLREDAGELIYKNTNGNIYIANRGDDGMALVTTRNTPNGLKASNSEIVVTDTIDAAITRAESDNYKNAVLADWRASAENILQGALASPFEAPVVSSAKMRLYYGDAAHNFELTAGNNQIVIPEGGETELHFNFLGERLPEITTASVTGVTITNTQVLPGDATDRTVVYTVAEITTNKVITVVYAGVVYTINLIIGNVVTQIKPFVGGNFQAAPITETWHSSDMVSNRAYDVYFALDSDIPTSGDILSPPALTESNATVASTPGDYYSITLHPKTGGFQEAGEYDFKCNGVTFLHVIAVND